MVPVCFLLLLLRSVFFVILRNFSTKPTLPSLKTKPKNLTSMEEKEEEEPKNNEEIRNESDQDVFKKLPDPILSSILSFLPVEEAVRTSILSRRWESLWRHTNHLDFDQKFLFSTEFQQWIQLSPPWPPLDLTTRIDSYMLMLAEIDNVVGLIQWILRFHLGPLRSCRILHMIESCRYDHVGMWVEYLIESKGIQELSLECETNRCWNVYEEPTLGQQPPELDICFENFSPLKVLELKYYFIRNSHRFVGSETLKTLKLNVVWIDEWMLRKILATCLCLENLSLIGCKKLKRLRVHSSSIKFLKLRKMNFQHIDVSASELVVMELDRMVTRLEGLVIEAPKLRVFRSYCDPLIRGRPRLGFGRLILTIKEIVAIFNALASIGYANIFEGLVTLSFGLDLNNVRELTSLPFILKSCHSLKNLEIHNEVTGHVEYRNDSLIPYYDLMFWETREACNWINQGLNSVTIKGFQGKRLEVRFVKYLIAKAAMIESIAIWFDDNCTWGAASAAESLLSPAGSASPNLSITLKPGKHYLAEVGGSWEEWISFLKLN